MAARGLSLLNPPPTPALLSPGGLDPGSWRPRGLESRGLGRLERKAGRTDPASTRHVVERRREAVDMEAQVANVAEKHGVRQRRAATLGG